MICPKCSSNKVVKNGKNYGSSRMICKDCNKTFYENKEPKYSNETKNMAIEMYLNSCGIRSIARILKTSPSLVLKWIKSRAKILAEHLRNKANEIEEKDNTPDIIEMDEIYTYIKKNKIESRYGLLILGKEVVYLNLYRKIKEQELQ